MSVFLYVIKPINFMNQTMGRCVVYTCTHNPGHESFGTQLFTLANNEKETSLLFFSDATCTFTYSWGVALYGISTFSVQTPANLGFFFHFDQTFDCGNESNVIYLRVQCASTLDYSRCLMVVFDVDILWI